MATPAASVAMEEKIWRNLPWDVLLIILSFLPIPVLCRFRVVSKRMAQHITHPAFAASVAKAPNKRMYKLTSIDFDRLLDSWVDSDYPEDEQPHLLLTPPRERHDHWEFHDEREARTFNLNFDFLERHNPVPYIAPRAYPETYKKTTLAADKGFVCAMWAPKYARLLEEIAFVCNPVTQSYTQLPPYLRSNNRSTSGTRSVNMIVDDDMQRFRIFITQAFRPGVAHDLDPAGWRTSAVFDSKTGTWARFPHPTSPNLISPTFTLKVGSILYMLFCCDAPTGGNPRSARWRRRSPVTHSLYAYDTASERWSLIRVKLPKGAQFIPQLATSGGRLFYVAFRKQNISISEIVRLGSSTNYYWKCSRVAEMPRGIFVRMKPGFLVGISEEMGEMMWSDYDDHVGSGANVVVIGFEGRITFWSIMGMSVDYSLVTEEWCNYVKKNVVCWINVQQTRAGLYGCLTGLSLSAVPEVPALEDDVMVISGRG